jgi:predicted kinase
MLYLLGGASRAGKSTLARRLLMQQCIPYFSIDALMMGFVNGMPEFGLDPDESEQARAVRLWPLLRAMAVNFLEETPTPHT